MNLLLITRNNIIFQLSVRKHCKRRVRANQTSSNLMTTGSECEHATDMSMILSKYDLYVLTLLRSHTDIIYNSLLPE